VNTYPGALPAYAKAAAVQPMSATPVVVLTAVVIVVAVVCVLAFSFYLYRRSSRR